MAINFLKKQLKRYAGELLSNFMGKRLTRGYTLPTMTRPSLPAGKNNLSSAKSSALTKGCVCAA